MDDDFTMLHVIMMLLLDSVLYAFIAWYVEAVWPGEYGIPRPWYFPCMVSQACLLYSCDVSNWVGDTDF